MLKHAIELPTDPWLEQWAQCLRPELVLDLCGEQLNGVSEAERDMWRCCRFVEALYDPARSIRLAYALLPDESISTQRTWPQGEIVYFNAPVRRPVSRRGQVLRANGAEIEAYVFPNDRRLRSLRKLQGRPDAIRTWKHWLTAAGDSFQIDEDSLRRVLIRYVPEQKWIIRLRARGAQCQGGAPGKRSIAVRISSPPTCHSLLRRHRAMRSDAARATFTVPRVVGADPSSGLLATEWAKGASLTEVLQTGPPDAVMQRLCEALAAFHATPIEGLVVSSKSVLCRRAERACADLVMARPQLGADLSRVKSRLLSGLADVEPVRPATLHNDLHWNQLRFADQAVFVLDLERMCLGDPLLDVANLAMQLRMLAHRPECGVNPSAAEAWTEALLDAWSGVNGQPIEPVRFGCYSAIALLELARGMMRHLRPGWRQLALQCLEQAHASMDSRRKEVLLT